MWCGHDIRYAELHRYQLARRLVFDLDLVRHDIDDVIILGLIDRLDRQVNPRQARLTAWTASLQKLLDTNNTGRDISPADATTMLGVQG